MRHRERPRPRPRRRTGAGGPVGIPARARVASVWLRWTADRARRRRALRAARFGDRGSVDGAGDASDRHAHRVRRHRERRRVVRRHEAPHAYTLLEIRSGRCHRWFRRRDPRIASRHLVHLAESGERALPRPCATDPRVRDRPSARRLAAPAADDSTVMVVGPACDRIQEGSGFGVGGEYVITNAHVVAGVDALQIVTEGGETYAATTVLFDAELDLAILHVDGAPWPSLSLTPLDADRGAGGAVLGYPGGRGPTATRAAVLRALDGVIGRDIYGRRRTERFVLELQTHVRPGNSGGPFVLSNGDVAGVVFAASTTDQNVGYALAASEVAPALERSIGQTQPVGTGPCIR